MPFGISGETSSSQTTQSSSQRVFEQDIFRQLFSGATGAAAGIDTSGLTTAAENLFSQGSGFLDSLQGVAGGTDVAGQFLEGRVSGEGGLVDEQIAGLESDLGRFFQEQILPGITSEAVGGGALGGGRQGVAEGAAAATIGREFQRGSTAIRTADLEARQRAAESLQSGRTSAAELGLRGTESQFNLANATTLASLSPFLTLSQILGSPTTLTESELQSTSESRKLSLDGLTIPGAS